LYPSGCQSHANCTNFGRFLFILHVTGGHFATNCMRMASTRLQDKRPVASKAAIFLQARCENNFLNKKIKTSLKHLRIYATHVLSKAYSLTLFMARSNLVRQFLSALKKD
jgi:hypothetical protein